MEPTTGLILRRITQTNLSVAAHKLATLILDAIAWNPKMFSKRGYGYWDSTSLMAVEAHYRVCTIAVRFQYQP